MPANALTELLRTLSVGQTEPMPAGLAERPRPQDRSPSPGRDFAGMLAENIRARPQPEPKPQPEPEPAERPPPASEARDDKPERTLPDEGPPALPAEGAAAENSPTETPAAPEPAAEPGKNAPTAGAQPTAEKPAAQPAPGQPETQSQTPTQTQTQHAGSGPINVGAAAQAGLSAVLQALLTTKSNSSPPNLTLIRPVRVDGGNHGGNQSGSPNSPPTGTQAEAATPQNKTGTLEVLRAVLRAGTEAEAPPIGTQTTSAKIAPEADPPNTPRIVGQNNPQTSQGGGSRPAAAAPQPPGQAKAQLDATGNQPSKPPNPLPQAAVMPEQGAIKSPAPGNVADAPTTPQNQPPSSDSTLALNLARLLLNVKVIATGSDSALQAGPQGEQSQVSKGPLARSTSAPTTQMQTAMASAAGSGGAGGSSFSKAGLAAQNAANTSPAQASDAGNEPSPLEQVVRAARAQIGARHSQVRLQLHPPELGQLRIDVRIDGKNIQMHLEAQTEAAHRLLSSRVSELRGTLQAQGLNVERVQVDLRGPQQMSAGHDQQDPSGLDQAMRDLHPEAHWGGRQHAESGPDPDEPADEPEHPVGEAGEEDQPDEAAPGRGVNLMA